MSYTTFHHVMYVIVVLASCVGWAMHYSAVHCTRPLVGYCAGTPEIDFRREGSEIIHRHQTAKRWIILCLIFLPLSTCLAAKQELEGEVMVDLAVGWLHQGPLPVVAHYLLCCVAVSCPGGRVCVRVTYVCTPHSMGGYIYCTVAVQFAGRRLPCVLSSAFVTEDIKR